MFLLLNLNGRRQQFPINFQPRLFANVVQPITLWQTTTSYGLSYFQLRCYRQRRYASKHRNATGYEARAAYRQLCFRVQGGHGYCADHRR